MIKWSQEKIVNHLIDLYRQGVPLKNNSLKKYPIYRAIYYKGPTGNSHFGSLKTAREAVAKKLEKQGHLDDAEEIRELNGPRKAHNKFTEEQKEAKRKELILQLRAKIKRGEDVSMRYQKKVDIKFANGLERYFDSYRDAFRIGGFDYSKDPDTSFTYRVMDNLKGVSRLFQ